MAGVNLSLRRYIGCTNKGWRDDDTKHEQEEKRYDEAEGIVGFGYLDLYNVQELIELTLEEPGIGVDYESNDVVKQLKKDFIGKKSKITYCYPLVIFFKIIHQLTLIATSQAIVSDT